MLRALCVLFFVSIIGVAQAQRAIGTWKFYLPYSSTKEIIDKGDEIIAATQYTLLVVDKETKEVQTLDKTNGLSEVGVSSIAYSSSLNSMIIGYSNSNIDIVSFNNNNAVYNLSDLKNKTITGDKTIYKIVVEGSFAYVCTGIGVLKINMAKKEVVETYKVASNTLATYDIAFLQGQVYVASSGGLKTANALNPNLQNYNNWQTISTLPTKPQKIHTVDNQLYAATKDSVFVFKNNVWSLVYTEPYLSIQSIENYSNALSVSTWVDSAGVYKGAKIVRISQNNTIDTLYKLGVRDWCFQIIPSGNLEYVAAAGGLYEYTSNQSFQNSFSINNPPMESVQLKQIGSELFSSVGGFRSDMSPMLRKGGVYVYNGSIWYSFGLWSIPNVTDGVGIDKLGDDTYLGTFNGGLVKYKGFTPFVYNTQNSKLENTTSLAGEAPIADVQTDKNGVLWMTNTYTTFPLKALDKDGNWYKFQPSAGNLRITKLLIDQNNNKWILNDRTGLIVFNEGDINNPSDDKVVRLESSAAAASECQRSNLITDFDEDKNGDIWVATSRGIKIYRCAENIFNNPCEASVPILIKGDGTVDANDTFAECLLTYEYAKAVAVDGGNRKWVGTSNGVFLISADGTKQLAHFTAQNSPLPSDDIQDVLVHSETGEVFISTALGLVSYMGEATKGDVKNGEVVVFPNPVPPSYNGVVTIDGLVDDAYFKITDLAGHLIYESTANGGRAIWDGKQKNGEKVHSGIFFVFSINELGKEKNIAKIIIAR